MTMHPQIGDVFMIPTGDGRVGIGQVVARYGKDGLYLAVFGSVVAAAEVLTRLPATMSTPIQFLALSLEARFHAGHWPIVARLPVPADVPLPAYKETVESAGRVVVEVVDYSGARRHTPRRCRSPGAG